MSQKIFRIFYTFCIAFLAPICSAQAAKVSNMTDEVQTIELRSGNDYTPVEIRPYRNYETNGGINVRYGNQELYVEEDMEYAIWPGNIFGPQRSNSLRRGG